MPTPKSLADLTTDINAIIAAMTAPESITPATLAGMLQELADSMYNQVDGITVGTVADPLIIPALFSSTINPYGDELKDIIQAILNAANATQVLVTGGVQGLPGEFLAIITEETAQYLSLVFDTGITPSTTYRKAATLKYPNDTANGGFDNGNNWLVDRFIEPTGAAKKFFSSGVSFEIIDPQSANTRTFKLRLFNKTTSSVLAESNEIAITNSDAAGAKFYFSDFNTASITPAPDDEIEVQLWEKQNTLGANTVVVKFYHGFVYNELQ